MRCRAARLLDDYVDGALSQRDAARVEDHVAVCAECRGTLGELRKTIELLQSMRDRLDAPDVTAAVMARVRGGEATPAVLDRWRARVARFLAGPLGAPLVTAAAGLLLFAVLPRIEIEINIPGRTGSSAAIAAATRPGAARAPEPRRSASAATLARRVNESMSREPSRLTRAVPLTCVESSSVEPCRDQHAFMTRLAMDNIWAFLAQIERVPEPGRDIWLKGLSRYAAESGAAAGVAERLRATGDPQAQRLAVHFEKVR